MHGRTGNTEAFCPEDISMQTDDKKNICQESQKKKPSVLESTWFLSSLEIASLQADMGSRNRRDLQGIESLVEGEKSQAISMLRQEFCFRVTQSPHRQKWKGTGSTQFSFTALKQTS